MENLTKQLKNYQCIPRELLFDSSLSDRARFVYCYMAAKPDDWDFNINVMATELGYCVDTLRKYIKELCNNKWLVKGRQEIDRKWGTVHYTLIAMKDTKENTNNSDTEKY